MTDSRRNPTTPVLPLAMTEERADSPSKVDDFVKKLKLKIPQAEHGALDSRMEALLNDPNADADDVILILLQEFNIKQ